MKRSILWNDKIHAQMLKYSCVLVVPNSARSSVAKFRNKFIFWTISMIPYGFRYDLHTTTVNPLYTGIRYNDEAHFNNNLNP